MIYSLIDSISNLVEQKIRSEDFCSEDTKVILALQVISLEINLKGEISDGSAGAINEIQSMIVHIHYTEKYAAIGNQIIELYYKLSPYHKSINTSELGVIGFNHHAWSNYFANSIESLLKVSSKKREQ